MAGAEGRGWAGRAFRGGRDGVRARRERDAGGVRGRGRALLSGQGRQGRGGVLVLGFEASYGDADGPEHDSALRDQSRTLLLELLTRQTLKTLLHYLGETNGEMHTYLHNYLADNPFPAVGSGKGEEWLTQLALAPLASVRDPGSSSIVSAMAKEAAGEGGAREVAPRDVAERVLKLRAHLAGEMVEDLGGIEAVNAQVMRAAVTKALGDGFK